MYRVAISRALCRGASQPLRKSAPVGGLIFRNPIVSRSPFASIFVDNTKSYSAAAGLSEGEVTGRIVDILKNFDKVSDPTKLSPTSHFSNDLGLDSLDTVEVVMAIEEEFSIEIPDKDADTILSVDKAVSYIMKTPDAH